MTYSIKLLAVLALGTALAAPAFAHHGGGSFDLSKSVTYTGKLTK